MPALRPPTSDDTHRHSPSATMAVEVTLPELTLEEGEAILLVVRPSPWWILAAPLPWLLGLSLAWMAMARWLHPLSDRDTLAGLSLLAILVFGWKLVAWLGQLHMLTDRRLITCQGILRRRQKNLPLAHLSAVPMEMSALERPLKLATLHPHDSLGTQCQTWPWLAHPTTVRNLIFEAQTRYAPGPSTGESSG